MRRTSKVSAITTEGMQLIGCAETVLEIPEAAGGPFLSHPLARLALVRAEDLDHRAVLHAMDQVLRGAEMDEAAPIRDLELYDQSGDVAEHVPAGIAARTLYTLLCRACETEPGQLTHRWIAESTARAVRTYRAADAVNAQRSQAAAARTIASPTPRP
jgi:hypothetical protein